MAHRRDRAGVFMEQEVCTGKKNWKRTLDSLIRETVFYSLGNENSLKLSEQGTALRKTVLSFPVSAVSYKWGPGWREGGLQ